MTYFMSHQHGVGLGPWLSFWGAMLCVTNWGDLEGNKISTSIQFFLMLSAFACYLFALNRYLYQWCVSPLTEYKLLVVWMCETEKDSFFFSPRNSIPWFIFRSWWVPLCAKLVLSHAMLIYMCFLDCSTYHVMEHHLTLWCIIHLYLLWRTFDVPVMADVL